MLKLTPHTGKRDLNTGGWEILPSPNSGEVLSHLESGFEDYLVRIRPEIMDSNIPEDVRLVLGGYLDKLNKGEDVGVILKYGHPDPTTGKYGKATVKSYKLGEVYSVKVKEALRLLNTDPFRYIFEEATDESGDGALVAPEDQIGGLIEQNGLLKKQLERLEQMILNMSPGPQSSPKYISKKNQLKALEE